MNTTVESSASPVDAKAKQLKAAKIQMVLAIICVAIAVAAFVQKGWGPGAASLAGVGLGWTISAILQFRRAKRSSPSA